MKKEQWQDIDEKNIEVAKLILEDSKNIPDNGIYNDKLLDNSKKIHTKPYTNKRNKIYAFASAAVACIVLVVGIGSHRLSEKTSVYNFDTSIGNEASQASNYEEIYCRLAMVENKNVEVYNSGSIFDKLGMSFDKVSSSLPTINEGTMDKNAMPEDIVISDSVEVSDSESDYYDTNEQTENVHEGDCVKTDGKYIYTLSNTGEYGYIEYEGDVLTEYDVTGSVGNKVIITKVDGTDMKNVSEIDLLSDITSYIWEEMYICKDKLIVVGGEEEYREKGFIEEHFFDERGYYERSTIIRTYDVSDRTNPKLESENKQEGAYVSSRLSGDCLYVVSTCDINKLSINHCVPMINDKAISHDCVYLPKYINDRSYTVITSIDINDSKDYMETVAVAGSTVDLYVSEENLYLIMDGREEKLVTDEDAEKDKGTETKLEKYQKKYISKAYENVDINKLKAYEKSGIYSYKDTTEIVKYEYSKGKLSFVAEAVVEGRVEDNLSFDEERGYLRFVTTSNNHQMEERRVDVYEGDIFVHSYTEGGSYIEFPKDTNNVYVLDEKLIEKAHIGGLAEGESIYSARYFGDYGYFVTFEQMDPLFSVDFTDMENPKIIGELKIPGFSEYLHFYGEGKLFGFGVETTDEGWSQGLKLEMYDISDNVAKQEAKYVMHLADYSEALYNYKSIMVSPDKNLIGFAIDDYSSSGANCSYLLFEYRNNKFVELMEVEMFDNDTDVRGFYIGQYLYVVSPNYGIKAVDIDNYFGEKSIEELRF